MRFVRRTLTFAAMWSLGMLVPLIGGTQTMNAAEPNKFIRYDQTELEIRKGYFFGMYPEAIAEIYWEKSEIADFGRCPQHPKGSGCVQYLVWDPLVIRLYEPPRDIFWADADTQSALVVSDRLLKALQKAGIRGYRVKPVTISQLPMDVVRQPSGRYHHLPVVGSKAWFMPTVHGCPNACPHCGKAPIVCQETCNFHLYCPKCHKEIVFLEGFSRPWPEGSPDPRIPMLGNPIFNSLPWLHRIEGRRWKGEDMLFGGQHSTAPILVSGRVRRLIEKFDSRVKFEDVLFDVSGMSPEMRRRLEKIK